MAKCAQNYHDCQRAVQWLRQHAQRLNIDPERIGVIGGSAGGHLAHMVALAPAALAAADPAAGKSSSPHPHNPRLILTPSSPHLVIVGLDVSIPVDGLLCGVNLYGPTDFLVNQMKCNLPFLRFVVGSVLLGKIASGYRPESVTWTSHLRR